MRPKEVKGMRALIATLAIPLYLAGTIGCNKSESRNEKEDSEKVRVVETDTPRSDTINWPALNDRMEEYIADPSAEGSEAITALIPDRGDEGRGGNRWEGPEDPEQMARLVDLTERGIEVMEKRIRQGDTSALRLLARFAPMTTGHMHEEVDIVLGSAITVMPEQLLRVLEQEGYRDLESIMGNLGPDYVDRYQARIPVYQKRIEALNRVDDPLLLPLRDTLLWMAEKDLHWAQLGPPEEYN